MYIQGWGWGVLIKRHHFMSHWNRPALGREPSPQDLSPSRPRGWKRWGGADQLPGGGVWGQGFLLLLGREDSLEATGRVVGNEGSQSARQVSPADVLTALACLLVYSLSHAQLSATPWTVTHQVPLSM